VSEDEIARLRAQLVEAMNADDPAWITIYVRLLAEQLKEEYDDETDDDTEASS